MHTNGRIVIHEIVQLVRSNAEGSDDSSGMHGFLAVGDAAVIEQIHDTVTEHLAVYSQVLVALQLRKDGVGNATDTKLESGTVLHQVLGDVLTDQLLLLARFLDGVGWNGAVVPDGYVEVRLVDYGVTEGTWQVAVYLGLGIIAVLIGDIFLS